MLELREIVIGNETLDIHLRRRDGETVIEHVKSNLKVIERPVEAPLWGTPIRTFEP